MTPKNNVHVSRAVLSDNCDFFAPGLFMVGLK